MATEEVIEFDFTHIPEFDIVKWAVTILHRGQRTVKPLDKVFFYVI